MRTRLTFLALVVASITLAAQTPYYGYEQITVANSAIGFTASKITEGNGHPQATRALCRLETAEIRYRTDGGTPTSSVGTLLEPGDVLEINADPVQIAQFLAIRTGSTSGSLSCAYSSNGK
jgi:hypothetical protein